MVASGVANGIATALLPLATTPSANNPATADNHNCDRNCNGTEQHPYYSLQSLQGLLFVGCSLRQPACEIEGPSKLSFIIGKIQIKPREYLMAFF